MEQVDLAKYVRTDPISPPLQKKKKQKLFSHLLLVIQFLVDVEASGIEAVHVWIDLEGSSDSLALGGVDNDPGLGQLEQGLLERRGPEFLGLECCLNILFDGLKRKRERKHEMQVIIMQIGIPGADKVVRHSLSFISYYYL